MPAPAGNQRPNVRRFMKQSCGHSSYLHDISFHLVTLRKQSTRSEQKLRPKSAHDQPQWTLLTINLWFFISQSHFRQYSGQKWLQLVGAYFGQLKWPPQGAPPSEVSCLELMLDLLIHYQVTMPINTPRLRKIGGPSTISCNSNDSQFYLPTRKEGLTLTKPLLIELSRIWLFTLEYPGTQVAMTPVPRSSGRSLRHFSYNNSVPSFARRPVLLAGQRVQTLLAAMIKPCTRTLKFRVSIYPTPDPRGSATSLFAALLLRLYSCPHTTTLGGTLARSDRALHFLASLLGPYEMFGLFIPWWLGSWREAKML